MTDYTRTYGYGPSDLSYATIVGFDTLSDCVAKAESWLQKGLEWSRSKRKYVPSTATRIEVKVYRFRTQIGKVVALRQNDGTYVTSVWF